jgi:hypothetical protein
MRPPTEAAFVFSGLNWICIGDEAIAAYVGEATESPPIASRASGSTLGQPRLRRSRGNPNCHQKCIQPFAAVICLYFSKGAIPGFQKGPRHSERGQYPLDSGQLSPGFHRPGLFIPAATAPERVVLPMPVAAVFPPTMRAGQ